MRNIHDEEDIGFVEVFLYFFSIFKNLLMWAIIFLLVSLTGVAIAMMTAAGVDWLNALSKFLLGGLCD